MHVLLIINFTTIALYGYVAAGPALTSLDGFNLLLLCYWAAEPLYPVLRYGFRLYWHVDDVSRQDSYRCRVCVSRYGLPL